jgi:hypothetical protein
MPSPFPGIDPFIEAYRWPDFHHELIAVIRESLVPVVRPRYVVEVEQHVYLHLEERDVTRRIRPDLFIGDTEPGRALTRSGGAGTAVLTDPLEITLPMLEEERRRYITIRDAQERRLITVIEVLSPANKIAGSQDQRAYFNKRHEVVRGGANLVEMDLLRGGERMPADSPLPAGDFLVVVCRSAAWPRAGAYGWSLREPIPTVPVPLAEGDPDVPLDLQSAFTLVYDRAGYDYSLDYTRQPEPPLPEPDAAWVKELLAARRPLTT